MTTKTTVPFRRLSDLPLMEELAKSGVRVCGFRAGV